MTDINPLRDLRLKIVKYFDLEALKLLASDLNMDWDDLVGTSKSVKVQALITHVEQHGRLQTLIDLLQQERPHISWTALPKTSLPEPPPGDNPIRTAVWNALYESLWNKKTFLKPFRKQEALVDKFSQRLWVDYFNKLVDARPQEPEEILQEIREYFFVCTESEFYDYLTFILNYWNDLRHYSPEIINEAVNKALARAEVDLHYVVEYHYSRFESGSFKPPDQGSTTEPR